MQVPIEFYAILSGCIIVFLIALYRILSVFKQKKENSKPGRNGLLPQQRMDQINKLVTEYLVSEQAFLRQRYSIWQLADEIGIPQHHLSIFINSYHKMNFNDFINKYRVYYSKIMMINGEWKYKTLQAIATESGFGNRTTYSTVFKKVTGMNPSDFIKELREVEADEQSGVNRIKEDCLKKCPEMKFLLTKKAAS